MIKRDIRVIINHMKRFLKITFVAILIASVLAVSGGLISYAIITKNATIQSNLLPQDSVNALFSDSLGNQMDGISDDFVSFEELPNSLKYAVISIEDKRFFSHKGVDTVRTAGAVFNNIKNRGMYEGGSTITQQLIKNTHLTHDKTIKRKLNEMKLARELERKYSKEEILTMYMNVVYFGNGMYGVKAASKGFFNKKVQDLTLAESATLAAVLKNPSKYSPLANKEDSLSRRNLVLSLMAEQGYIAEDEMAAAQNEGVNVDTSATFSNTQSYMLSAAYEAASILGISVQTLLSMNYKIETYLNPDYQNVLTDIVGNSAYYATNDSGVRGEGLSIILDNDTAGIAAYFGSKKRSIYGFNRPLGSTVKPILIYAPAFENGLITAASPVLDEKTDFSGYTPSNFGDSYLGWTDIRTAIKTSSNVAAVKTYNMVGTENISSFASTIGIDISTDRNNATVALGNLAPNDSFIKILGAYCALANGGNYSAPAFVKSISDKSGSLLYSREKVITPVLTVENAYIITDILKENAQSGTAKGLGGLGFDVAAKTGTVGDDLGNTDAYNVGYTTKNTYLVWHGNSTGNAESNLPLIETGGSYATRAARDILSRITSVDDASSFIAPYTVQYRTIDAYAQLNKQTVALATDNTPKEFLKDELFAVYNMPQSYSTCFDNFTVENVRINAADGVAKLSFNSEGYLYYDIYREFLGLTFKVATLTPWESESREYVDTLAPYLKYFSYKIMPYFYNEKGEKIEGIPYSTEKIYLKSEFDYYD